MRTEKHGSGQNGRGRFTGFNGGTMKRIDTLSEAQRARMDDWADQWIEVGLRTGAADRPMFERAARACYRFAGIPTVPKIIWCPSPLVAVTAGPLAASLLREKGGKVREAIHETIHEAIYEMVRGAVHGAVHEAVHEMVRGAVHETVHRTVSGMWSKYIGGQFWVSGYYWGAAFNSFLREVCGLELPGDLWERGRAYEETMQSACWWWPHSQYIMVSERPRCIHRELTQPDQLRGVGSHRLHCADGPAMAWPDGFAMWAWHGVRVTEQIICTPDTLTPEQIAKERNAQVRQVMVERLGIERVCQMFQAKRLDQRGEYELLMLDLRDGRKRPYLKMLNPSMPGIYHIEGVPPHITTVQHALNWRAGDERIDWVPDVLT